MVGGGKDNENHSNIPIRTSMKSLVLHHGSMLPLDLPLRTSASRGPTLIVTASTRAAFLELPILQLMS